MSDSLIPKIVPIADVIAHAVRKIGGESEDRVIRISSVTVTVRNGRAEVYFTDGNSVDVLIYQWEERDDN